MVDLLAWAVTVILLLFFIFTTVRFRSDAAYAEAAVDRLLKEVSIVRKAGDDAVSRERAKIEYAIMVLHGRAPPC